MQEFRPKKVAELFGQPHLYDVLFAWEKDTSSVPSSIMFHGPYGCGKTSLARMVASWLTKDDIIEINAADSRGIDDVRDWADSAKFSPLGGCKVYIIDELHQLTAAAQSALLKVIEEPPKGIYFFLCTTEPGKLIPMISSRCVKIEVKLLNEEAIGDIILYLGKGKIPDQICESIALRANGHARDAVKDIQSYLQFKAIPTFVALNNSNGKQMDVEKLINKLCTTGLSKDEAFSLTSYPDENKTFFTLERSISNKVLEVTQIKQNYFNILYLFSLKKQYLVSVKDIILYVSSLF